MVAGSMRASACAVAITWACPATLGAAKPAFSAPSLFTAELRITACTLSPSASASDNRLSTTTAAPLPGIVPWARASNGRHRPSGENRPPSDTG
jgi:hypothetical protein